MKLLFVVPLRLRTLLILAFVVAAFVLHTADAQSHPRHHHHCRWQLKVTGGNYPGQPIVLHLTNTCVNNGGPQELIPVGKVP